VLCQTLQHRFGMSEPVARLISIQAAKDTGWVNNRYYFTGLPSIRDVATKLKPRPFSYALAVVKVCAESEKKNEMSSRETHFDLPPRLAAWVAIVNDAVLNHGEPVARKKAAAKLELCPICKEWKLDGKITHLENCPATAWSKVAADQGNQPSSKQQEQLRVSAAAATAMKKAKLGPPLNAPAPKKSKSHPQSSWPPIIPGGAVETNRRKH
jgi:hypothetical protein